MRLIKKSAILELNHAVVFHICQCYLVPSIQTATLMMTPICPRLLNLINDFVLLRFRARAPEGLSAIEVIVIIIIIGGLSAKTCPQKSVLKNLSSKFDGF